MTCEEDAVYTNLRNQPLYDAGYLPERYFNQTPACS